MPMRATSSPISSGRRRRWRGRQGGRVQHLKLHGALANMAAEDAGLACACFEGVLAVYPDLILMVIAGTAQDRAAEALGARRACEIFADRAYAETGLLVDRREPGAVLHHPAAIADRVLSMLRAGAIVTVSGRQIPARIDTICLHGDTPEAVAIATALRASLEGAGVALAPFAGGALKTKRPRTPGAAFAAIGAQKRHQNVVFVCFYPSNLDHIPLDNMALTVHTCLAPSAPIHYRKVDIWGDNKCGQRTG